MNGVLAKINEHIEDITVDFSDGMRLTDFLELLSGKKINKKPEEPKSRIHKINNVFLALQFLESLEVKVEGVAAEGESPSFLFFVKPLFFFHLHFLYCHFHLHFLSLGSPHSQTLWTATKS